MQGLLVVSSKEHSESISLTIANVRVLCIALRAGARAGVQLSRTSAKHISTALPRKFHTSKVVNGGSYVPAAGR